ncbi:CAAX prenyl protease 2, partial [Brachionus plicatilis]
NLLDGKRPAESAAEDTLIRKFLYGTFQGLFASEILIKRKFNTINIGFLIKLPRQNYSQKVYFLVGYAEELLSSWLKCVVKIQVQTIYNKNDLVFRTCCLVCLFLASFYVISLYLWSRENRYKRNEPAVIKRRFISVILSSLISLIILYEISATSNDSNGFTINEWTGLRFDLINLFFSILVSLGLTTLLFIGPVFQNFLIEYHDYLSDLHSENTTKSNELYKNYVISTLTEEFVFRSCMLPLLIGHMTWSNSILITPLFFGTAHLHHIYEGYKAKEMSLKFLIMRHLFQFGYTYSFGVYSSYLFLRTGSFFASFVAHSFCNLMGFPDFDGLINEFNGKTRIFLVI